MAAPTTGYGTATISNPSSALTDFSLMIDLSRMHADWWSAVNTSDGTRGRAYKSDGTTELACDWIDFDDTDEEGLLRVKFSGTLASSGTQTIRIYPPVTGNAAVAASATYGSDNAYDSSWEVYLPNGAGTDRTSNGNDGTNTGVTTGDSTGKIGVATDFSGIGSGDNVSLGEPASLDIVDQMTVMAWINPDDQWLAQQPIIAKGDTQYQIRRSSETGVDFFVSPSWATASLSSVLSFGTWAHVVGRVDSSDNVNVFADDVMDSSSATTTTPFTSNAYDIDIGRDPQNTNREYDGQIQEVQIHSTGRADAWISQEYEQTDDQATFWGTWGWTAGGSTAYSITAESGTFTETGTAADLLKGYAIDAGAGSFTETGTAAGLFHGFTIDAGVGTFTLTGQDATLQYGANTSISAETGAFTFTGSDAGLYKGYAIDAGAGEIVLTGSDATLTYAAAGGITAEPGTFTATGTDADLLKTWKLTADGGVFLQTGTDASLNYGLALNAETGGFIATGSDAEFIRTWLLSADAGTIAYTGSNATLTYDGGTTVDVYMAMQITGKSGTIAITGKSATVTIT